MILLYSVLPGTYAVIAAAVGRAFGPRYYAPNLGLVFSATLAYFSIIITVSQVGRQASPLMISPTSQVDVLFHLLGYSGMFLMAGAAAASGLLVTVFMAGDIQYERERKRAGADRSTGPVRGVGQNQNHKN